MKRDWKNRAIRGAVLVLDVAKGTTEACGPLKAVLASISAIYAQYKAGFPSSFGGSFQQIFLQETATVKAKIESLSLCVAVLEKVFEKPTEDVAEKMCRKELLMCEI